MNMVNKFINTCMVIPADAYYRSLFNLNPVDLLWSHVLMIAAGTCVVYFDDE